MMMEMRESLVALLSQSNVYEAPQSELIKMVTHIASRQKKKKRYWLLKLIGFYNLTAINTR